MFPAASSWWTPKPPPSPPTATTSPSPTPSATHPPATSSKTTTRGTLTLNGTNTYTGTTTVGGGTLKLARRRPRSRPAPRVTLGAGGTLDTSDQADLQHARRGSRSPSRINAGGGGSQAKIAPRTSTSATRRSPTPSPDTPDDPVYVLATYTGTCTVTTFHPCTRSAHRLHHSSTNHEGNKIALVQDAASGFAAWQAANSTAGDLDEDHDDDGVSNGIEFFTLWSRRQLRLHRPARRDQHQRHPQRHLDQGHRLHWHLRHRLRGGNLARPPESWTTETLGGTVAITGPNNEFVKYTFPAGTKNFARLKVTGP